jgi:hypothetical protein
MEKCIFKNSVVTFILSFLLVTATLCSAVHANEVSAPTPLKDKKPEFRDIFLANINTDHIKKSYDLSIRLNQQRLITAILTKNVKKNKLKIYPVNVLGKPIVLVKAVGIELVTLACTNFATSRGCDITIEYPYNVATGNFKKFHAKLVYQNHLWQLQETNGKRFTRLHLKAKKILGVLIGIKRITPTMVAP